MAKGLGVYALSPSLGAVRRRDAYNSSCRSDLLSTTACAPVQRVLRPVHRKRAPRKYLSWPTIAVSESDRQIKAHYMIIELTRNREMYALYPWTWERHVRYDNCRLPNTTICLELHTQYQFGSIILGRNAIGAECNRRGKEDCSSKPVKGKEAMIRIRALGHQPRRRSASHSEFFALSVSRICSHMTLHSRKY